MLKEFGQNGDAGQYITNNISDEDKGCLWVLWSQIFEFNSTSHIEFKSLLCSVWITFNLLNKIPQQQLEIITFYLNDTIIWEENIIGIKAKLLIYYGLKQISELGTPSSELFY